MFFITFVSTPNQQKQRWKVLFVLVVLLASGIRCSGEENPEGQEIENPDPTEPPSELSTVPGDNEITTSELTTTNSTVEESTDKEETTKADEETTTTTTVGSVSDETTSSNKETTTTTNGPTEGVGGTKKSNNTSIILIVIAICAVLVILAAGFLLYRIHRVNKKMESSDIMAASVRDKKKSKEKNKGHQKDAKHKGSQESAKTKPSGYERVK
uniref:Candidate secreted effector n=1 Tax=Meloidogyne incognita TaxID=6306 RepID=A0A914LB09_MELIC